MAKHFVQQDEGHSRRIPGILVVEVLSYFQTLSIAACSTAQGQLVSIRKKGKSFSHIWYYQGSTFVHFEIEFAAST